MRKRGSIFRLVGFLAGITFMTFLFLSEAKEDPPETGKEIIDDLSITENTSGQEEKVRSGCVIIQEMRFQRCGHSVARRIEAPKELAGKMFSEVKARYEEWQIEDFSPGSISMSREVMLFCPMHLVLTVNDAGEAVLTKNEYGDGMAIQKTFDRRLDDLSEEKKEKLLTGIAFDSEAEAEAWLTAD